MTCRVSPARSLALFTLTEVLENGAYANIALRQALADTPLDARDKALVTQLVNETLRNLIRIDHTLGHFSNTPLPKMKPFIKNLLRLSVCQLCFLDKIPASAAVNEAVKIAKAHGFGALGGFVNGILRGVARNPLSVSPNDVSLYYSYPAWLYDALVRWLGEADARLFCQNSHRPPATTVYTNTTKISPQALADRLREEGIACQPGKRFAECLTLTHTADLAALPSFGEGLFFAIDEGAVQAVKALNPAPGQHLLDLCAAPGGKSFAAACMMQNQGRIQAFDLHPHRARLMQEAAKRLGLDCIDIAVRDATLDPAVCAADAVLLDAPCSGLGIIRRRPDIKINRKPEDIDALAQVQRKLLHAASDCVKPGGTLVYCTCTVAREENMDNVRWFAQSHPFDTEDEHGVQLPPTPHNDAFFIARLVKRHDA
jgi:16S rRNA (cytosine967-C5)-methyltransferase